MYVRVDNKQDGREGPTAYVHCRSHEGCYKRNGWKGIATFRGTELQMLELPGAQHNGEERKIDGYTTAQHSLLVTQSARTKEELVRAFRSKNVECPSSRSLSTLLGPPGERVEARRCLLSVGSLRSWLEKRTWQELKARGKLHKDTLAVVNYTGLEQDSPDPFCVVLIAPAFLDELEKLDTSLEGMHLYMDGVWKKTERLRVQRAMLLPNGLTRGHSAASEQTLGQMLRQSNRRGARRLGVQRSRVKTKPNEEEGADSKNNGLVLLQYGYSTMRYTQGRVCTRRFRRKREEGNSTMRGAVKKYRRHYNPLALAFASGEAEESAAMVSTGVENLVKEERPHLLEKLQNVRACTSDQAAGFLKMWGAQQGARPEKSYTIEHGVCSPDGAVRLAVCEEHAVRIATMPSEKGGRRFLCARTNITVKTISSYLAEYMRISARQLDLLWFDRVWYHPIAPQITLCHQRTKDPRP